MKLVLFDFDGTIADTFNIAIDTVNKFAPIYNYSVPHRKDIEKLRSLTMHQIIKKMKLSIYKLPVVLQAWRSEQTKNIEHAKAHKGIKQAIISLKQKHFIVGILSSSEEKTINKFLKKEDIKVDFVYSGSSLFGKNSLIKKIMKQNNLKNTQIIYVGDEVRDIEAAKKAKIKSIAVTWGFNNSKALKKAKPDYLISNPKELKSISNLF